MRTILIRALILATTVATVVVHLVAVLFPANYWAQVISGNFYPISFIPDEYVFLTLIPVVAIGWVTFTLYAYLVRDRDHKLVAQITPWYVLGGFASCLWLILWSLSYTIVSLLFVLGVLFSLIAIYIQINRARSRTDNNLRARHWMVRIPFSIYLAWISVITVFTGSVSLYSLGVHQDGPIWAAGLIFFLGFLALMFLLLNHDWTFPVVIMWCVVGIAVKLNKDPLILFAVVTVVATLVYALGLIFYNQLQHVPVPES